MRAALAGHATPARLERDFEACRRLAFRPQRFAIFAPDR